MIVFCGWYTAVPSYYVVVQWRDMQKVSHFTENILGICFHNKKKHSFLYELTLIIVFFCLQDLVWPKGWPLTTETGDVILHIGTIDESFIHFYDAYICVKPGKKRFFVLP